jgi:hypothetical protein
VTVDQANGMGIGPGTMGLTLLAFLALWVVMMAAMMLPSVAPMVIVWVRSVSVRATAWDRVNGVGQFLAGYLVVWAAFGLLAYVAFVGTGHLVDSSPTTAKWVGAAIFAVAGIYQLTPLKEACLRHCRTPVGSLFHYASFRGPARDLRVGIHHGAYCVACGRCCHHGPRTVHLLEDAVQAFLLSKFPLPREPRLHLIRGDARFRIQPEVIGIDGHHIFELDGSAALDSGWLDDAWLADPSDRAASFDRETPPLSCGSLLVQAPRPVVAPSPPTPAADVPQQIFAVVNAWRAAERVLDGLVVDSPPWNRVHAELVGLRALHHRLFDARVAAAAGHGEGPIRPVLTMMAWGPTWTPARVTP